MIKQRVTVLGGGLVGRHIALDLSDRYDVTCIDQDKSLYKFFENTDVKFFCGRIHEPDLPELLDNLNPDLVVVALPGHMAYNVVETVIRCGKNLVDISFMPEDPYSSPYARPSLQQLAKEHKVHAVLDMGIAPGLCGMMLGYAHFHSSTEENYMLDEAKILVGGNPVECKPPHYYKAPFSPIDVIEEYTRTARFIVDSKVVRRPALTDPEDVKECAPGMIAFNTDGLRTLLKNIPAHNMVEKTVRYLGHYNAMSEMKTLGFFDKENVANTAKILLPKWKYEEGEADWTWMKVLARGNGKTYQWIVEDKMTNGVLSMARTTGYSCNAIASLMLTGLLFSDNYGLHLPEQLSRALPVTLKYLKDRGIKVSEGTL